MATIWVRVWYRPRDRGDCMWTYGWSFPAPSMAAAWDTVCKVGDARQWHYRINKIRTDDFDHPKNRKAMEKVFRKHAFHAPANLPASFQTT